MFEPAGKYVLRDYQSEAVNAGVQYFKDPKADYGALMVLPTGSGKSLVIAGIAKELDEPTLIFQPSKEILEQNFNKLIAYGEVPTIYSASMNSKRISNLTLATIGSVRNNKEIFKRFKNIIIDECHFVNAKRGMYRDFLTEVGGKVLGLTATPYRLITDGYGGSILKFLTRTRPRVLKKVIHITQNQTLFDNGYLSGLEYINKNGFDSNKLQLNTTGADYTDRSVKQYYESIDFSGKLTKVVLDALNTGRKNVLVFTRFIEESRQLVNDLRGIAEIVTAETPKREREGVIERFRKGQTKVVSNVGVLTTGFDFPELETIIMARPTMSLALYYQMIGRGVRIHPEKDKTLVVDLCDNFRKFGRVEDLKLSASRGELWAITSNGRQLTNVYYGDRGFK